MGREIYFDNNVLYYEKYRPTYGIRIFEDIIEYSNINSSSKLIEIGCGTGHATTPFLKTGAKLTAIEIGKNLANFTKNKFLDYSNLEVINTKFEDFIATEEVDLIFSATAFHWIQADFGYRRCKDILKENGVLALFWNISEISEKNKELKDSINKIYDEYLPKNTSQSYEERCEGLQWYLSYYGYKDIVMKIYKNYRTLDSNSFIGLLHTYSDHMALPKNIRDELFSKIYDEIEKYKFIEIEDKIDLHMGKK